MSTSSSGSSESPLESAGVESSNADSDAGYDMLVLSNVEEAGRLADDLAAVKVLAVDTERGRHQGTEHISLIQLAYKKDGVDKVQVVIFDMLESSSKDMLDQSGLRAALTSHQIVKVIHDCREDSRVLSDDFGIDMACVFDSQIAHAVLQDKQNYFRVGLNVILEKYGGKVNICKGDVQHSDDLFDRRPLSEVLLRYAAEDVSYLIDVHDEMKRLLYNKGQLESAIERSKENLYVPPNSLSSERKTFGSILDSTVPLEISKYVQFNAHGAYSLHDASDSLEQRNGECSSTNTETDDEVRKLFDILPSNMRNAVQSDGMVGMMTEIVLDLERRPLVRYMCTDSDRTSLCGPLLCSEVQKSDLEYICQRVGDFSTDNRSGLPSTLHRISRKLNRSGDVIALTLRVGRAVEGTTAMIADIVHSKRSVLLLGVPGVGKTTVLREYSRLLAHKDNTRVEIVDTSNEIAGDGDVPHRSVGMARRMMVPDRREQYKIMIEAVQNHMPEVIVVDEIGTKLEAQAVADVSQRGVKIVATAHGIELADILRNPELSRLMGGTHTVVLGDDEMKRRKTTNKSVRERKAPPVFDTVIELRNQRQWYIYHDTAAAVDDILADRTPVVEIRSIDTQGCISVRKSKLV